MDQELESFLRSRNVSEDNLQRMKMDEVGDTDNFRDFNRSNYLCCQQPVETDIFSRLISVRFSVRYLCTVS